MWSEAKEKREVRLVKDVEIRLISELMKNSHRNDRELAKTIGASQPTVTRLRSRLEKEGIIREYTMIPDFRKLGFEIAVITFIRFSKELSNEEFGELRKTAKEIQRKRPAAILAALNGMGLGFNRVFISFHKNYSSYMKVISLIKTHGAMLTHLTWKVSS